VVNEIRGNSVQYGSLRVSRIDSDFDSKQTREEECSQPRYAREAVSPSGVGGADREVRVLILTGAGRAFSAGGDREYLRQIAAGEQKDQEALAKVHAGTIRCMLGLSIPVIAAVNGPAVGYAAGLVAMCDLVVIGEDGFLCDPHVTFGIGANTATQLIWPRLTSEILARELLMSGRRVGAAEALQIGLANRQCASGMELQTAMELAKIFAALPPAGVASTKRAFNQPLIDRVERVLGVRSAPT
jgi:enoyl-CoA hydratase